MKNNITKLVSKEIELDIIIEKIKNKKFGDFSTPVAFSLAKIKKQSPEQVAKSLIEKFNKYSCFSSVNYFKGFINFTLSLKFLNEYANIFIKDDFSIYSHIKKSSILLEYVSANPTGPLHIGHARGAVVGSAIYNIAKQIGHKIDSEYYINDAGKQIYLLGLSVYLRAREILGFEVKFPDEFYRGDYIIDLSKKLLDEYGKNIFLDDNNIDKISNICVDNIIRLIKSDLKEIGVVFDSYISEKSLYKNWQKIFDILEQKGATYKKDNKIWLKTTTHKDQKDRVIVREDKVPTYLAGDIIYHNYKYERKYDRYINIWGADHHGYIPRVKSSIEYLGYNSKLLDVVLIQMVALLKNGKPYKMSKRSGGFILISDITKEIGRDGVNYLFASKKCDTHLEFDIDKLIKQDSSNPLFYINYAHSRINSIFKKANKSFDDVLYANFDNISDKARELLFEALLLPSILQETFDSLSVQKLTDYLYELASLFHRFYNNSKILNNPNEDSYLKIFVVVAYTIKKALKLLNIEAKNKM